MAWEDRTTFDAIHGQFGLTEREVIALMKRIETVVVSDVAQTCDRTQDEA